jgi:hypothetical protein
MNTTTPEKLYKCQGSCGEEKPASAFYLSKAGHASPYCIACNTDACLFQKYKTELRQNREAFLKKVKAKDRQVQIMLRAMATERVQV